MMRLQNLAKSTGSIGVSCVFLALLLAGCVSKEQVAEVENELQATEEQVRQADEKVLQVKKRIEEADSRKSELLTERASLESKAENTNDAENVVAISNLEKSLSKVSEENDVLREEAERLNILD